MFNAFLALLCLFPALPFWRREKYQAPTTPQPAETAAGGRERRGSSAPTGCFCQIDIIMGG